MISFQNSLLERIVFLDGKVKKDIIGKYPIEHIDNLFKKGVHQSFDLNTESDKPSYILFTSVCH